ncbi:MAG: hypothetical protein PVG59_17760 [Desulfobacterales bacterium]|jgi:hypothetical protein
MYKVLGLSPLPVIPFADEKIKECGFPLFRAQSACCALNRSTGKRNLLFLTEVQVSRKVSGKQKPERQ